MPAIKRAPRRPRRLDTEEEKGKRGDSNDPNPIPNREATRSDPKSKIKALLYFVSGISISTSSPGHARKGFLAVRRPFDWFCPRHKL